MPERHQLPADIVKFLEQPGQIAILATLGSGGYPHLTPVWYMFDDGALWIWMRKRRQKFLNLLRHSQVGLYIQAVDDVHRGVTLQGDAHPSEGGLAERCRQIAQRYVRPDELEIWVEHMLYSKNVIVQIVPTWWAPNGSSWNL